ncbi:MAG TPA: LysR substrate-binding domain-containing protein [Arachnia sp.]|nr:LysR substrate-binding domain-containing protein [Arachnia sp.]HMT87178.1 LysR substrate-binding domain-containing protein [Arachnia sp.]
MNSATDGLRIGYVPGVTLTKWRRVWAERFPRLPLEVTEVSESEQRLALFDDRVDMCFVRGPIATDDLHVIPLYDEVTVAWVGKEHPVAAFDEITLADLADEDMRSAYDQASIDAAVAEVAVLRVPLSVARTHNRRDLVHRPIADAPPSTVGLAWPTSNEHPLIQEFIGVVRGRSANSSRTVRERADAPKKSRPARPPSRGRSPRR